MQCFDSVQGIDTGPIEDIKTFEDFDKAVKIRLNILFARLQLVPLFPSAFTGRA